MAKTTKISIAVIGEGETEWFYFDNMRTTERFNFKFAPDLPQHSDMGHMVKLVDDYVRKQFDKVFCIVDMDRILSNDKEKKEYAKLKTKYTRKAYRDKVCFLETNPCTEFWFLLHFLPNPVRKQYGNYETLEKELQKYVPGYEKTVKYFKKTKIYDFLKENGNIERAISNSDIIREWASENEEDRIAYSEIQGLIKTIKELNS